MLTQDEKVLKVLQQIPFVAASYRKIVDALKEELSAEEVYLALGTLVTEGKINMAMNSKGDPEYSIKWNPLVDEERKLIAREFNKRFEEKTIFYPRYEGYVANLDDNFVNNEYSEFYQSFKEFDNEYGCWHRNAKSGVVYPPKMHSLSSANVLTYNVLAGLELDPSQVEYAVEFEVIAAEPMRDRPEEISAPKTQFDAIVNYADAVDFVQGNFLEHFYQPFRQSMWAYQFGNRYLFDDEAAVEAWRNFTKKANYVYFDGYQVIKTLVAIYSDVLANPDDYKGKKVSLLNINWNVSNESSFANLAAFQKSYDEEARRAETQLNEFLNTLPLPEGTTLTYQYLTVEEVAENLSDSVKEYVKNRYVGF
jgi:hypothetical protein